MKNLKTLSKVFVAVGMMALAVACSKSSDSSPAVAPIVSPYGCPTCYPVNGGGTNMTVRFHTFGGEMDGSLNLAVINGTQVTVQGQVVVSGQNPSYLCGLPAGTYSISTSTPGTFYYGNISNLGLQMSSGLQMQIYQAVLVNTNNQYSLNVLYGQLPCGSFTTTN